MKLFRKKPEVKKLKTVRDRLEEYYKVENILKNIKIFNKEKLSIYLYDIKMYISFEYNLIEKNITIMFRSEDGTGIDQTLINPTIKNMLEENIDIQKIFNYIKILINS